MLGYDLNAGGQTKGVDANYKLEEVAAAERQAKVSEQDALDVVTE